MAFEPIHRPEGIIGEGANDPADTAYQDVLGGRADVSRATGAYLGELKDTAGDLRKAKEDERGMNIGVKGVLGGGAAVAALAAAIAALGGPLSIPIAALVGAGAGMLGGGGITGAVDEQETEELEKNIKSEDFLLGQSPRAQAAKKVLEAKKYDLAMAEIGADAAETVSPSLDVGSRTSKKKRPQSRRRYKPGTLT